MYPAYTSPVPSGFTLAMNASVPLLKRCIGPCCSRKVGRICAVDDVGAAKIGHRDSPGALPEGSADVPRVDEHSGIDHQPLGGIVTPTRHPYEPVAERMNEAGISTLRPLPPGKRGGALVETPFAC
jgi:hypothetical protein